MNKYRLQDLQITLEREGLRKYVKASYPVRYGCYSEIESGAFRYQFNLQGEVKYITGTGPDWPHPAEWLKRTIGDDWVYYSTGSYYAGVVDLFGEYYLPCPSYPSNSLFKENPFARPSVAVALHEFAELSGSVHSLLEKSRGINSYVLDFLKLVSRNSPGYLRRRGDRLQRILQARISVLPPDCRHVDYDVVPLMISDGCLYNCSFCEVKSGLELTCRSRDDIAGQLLGLQEFLGSDLVNYNSVFLGQHDSLCAEPDDIIFAASKAYEVLDIRNSYMQGPKLFLFGSAESFLRMETSFWNHLNRLPFYTYVNLGLESLDGETLDILKKPVNSAIMQEAFQGMLAINRNYENIEVTANFLLGEGLPAGHLPSLNKHLGSGMSANGGKGCIYLSPLKGSGNTRKLLEEFREIKRSSRVETLLYLIQRL